MHTHCAAPWAVLPCQCSMFSVVARGTFAAGLHGLCFPMWLCILRRDLTNSALVPRPADGAVLPARNRSTARCPAVPVRQAPSCLPRMVSAHWCGSTMLPSEMGRASTSPASDATWRGSRKGSSIPLREGALQDCAWVNGFRSTGAPGEQASAAVRIPHRRPARQTDFHSPSLRAWPSFAQCPECRGQF